MASLLQLLARGGDEAVIVVGVIIFIVFFLLVLMAVTTESEPDRRLSSLASTLRGRLISGGAFEQPSIAFQVRDLNAILSFAVGKYARTSIAVRVPMFSEGRLSVRFSGFFGPDYKGVGEKSFDVNYVVKADPASLTARIFSPDRLGQVIGTIRRLKCAVGFSLRLEPGQLEVQVAEHLTTWNQVQELVQCTEEFLGYVLTMPEPGIQWGERVERLSGRCPICSTSLREPLVRCGRCRSPHHQECWEYLGRCATFGCDPGPRRKAA